MHSRWTTIFFCVGIIVSMNNDRVACESFRGNETIELLQAEEANTISLQETVLFTNPDGREAIAPTGTYQVEPVPLTALRLLPFGNKSSLVIKAEQTRHEENIQIPIALLIVDDHHLTHVVLLMPKRTGLEAIGSPSSDRSRGGPPRLTPAEIHDALMRKKSALERSGTAPPAPR